MHKRNLAETKPNFRLSQKRFRPDLPPTWLALLRSDVDWFAKASELDVSTPRKFRTQFGDFEGTPVHYAVYHVLECGKLMHPSTEKPQRARQTLVALLRRCPGVVPSVAAYVAKDAFELAYGEGFPLEDTDIMRCVRSFIEAGNQFRCAADVRALGTALIAQKQGASLIMLMQPDRVALLADADKFALMRAAVASSDYVDALMSLDELLWPGGKVPDGLCDPDTRETLLDVWLKECRVRQKLSILLRSQTPDAGFVLRFRKEVDAVVASRAVDTNRNEAAMRINARHCLWLISVRVQGRMCTEEFHAME